MAAPTSMAGGSAACWTGTLSIASTPPGAVADTGSRNAWLISPQVEHHYDQHDIDGRYELASPLPDGQKISTYPRPVEHRLGEDGPPSGGGQTEYVTMGSWRSSSMAPDDLPDNTSRRGPHVIWPMTSRSTHDPSR